MLVYGDIVRRCTAADLLREIGEDLTAALEAADPTDALTSALIGLGQLAQAVADLEHAALGCDARSPNQDALNGALRRLAEALQGGEPPPSDLLAGLQPLAPLHLEAREPEGFAFYAVYPEAYAEAAAPLASPGDWRVIGIRSIGASLAATVAAALGAPAAVTVRPVGHPFTRRIALAPDLVDELRIHGGRYAVVDEGPGLSGSSFGAVSDALEALGVTPARIHVFPSHGEDLGPHASTRHRERWQRTPRHSVDFDTAQVERWVEPLVGRSVEPPRDLSGGGWRPLRYDRESEWPPSNAAQERLKSLVRTESGAWLARFAGLGRVGARKLALARTLHAAGFAPEPAGLRRGFLVERWVEPAAAPPGPPPLAEYLRLRATLAAEPRSGASLEALLEMAKVNTAEAGLDPSPLHHFNGEALQARVRPVLTDGRLHRWEWVADPEGRWLKTDALDHHAAHDLIGAQDIVWDLVGAEAEWGLDPDAAEGLGRALNADRELLALLRPCYLAFQLGAYAMAAAAHAGWPEEAARLEVHSRRYRTRLAETLDTLPPSR